MLSFEPMGEEGFRRFIDWLNRDYAQHHTDAGTWAREDALKMAEAETARLLPAGRETPDHYLRNALDESGARVGEVWFAARDEGGHKVVWIFWIGVNEAQRRRGYGREMLVYVEGEARRLGASQVGLHVFATNSRARALYESVGYQPAGIIMRKTLAR
ncbi:MAG: GNAT family N-acetyltransferase [Thermoplasmata archaeon]